MSKLNRTVGVTGQILQVWIQDSSSSTGAGLGSLVFNSSGLTATYHRDTDTAGTTISLVTMTEGTFTSGGFKAMTGMAAGWYQFCPPNACFASGAKSVALHLSGVTNMAPVPIEIDLDPEANVTQWVSGAIPAPAATGVPDVNAKNVNNVSASAVTTIAANIGSSQPLNFTGTAGSALVQTDVIDAAGTAWASGAIVAGSIAAAAAEKVADALLNRNVAGGSNAGRLVKEALFFLRNKWTVASGNLTVYTTDDATPSWTGTVGTDAAAVPIVSTDPA